MESLRDFFSHVMSHVNEEWMPTKREMSDNIKTFDIMPNVTDVTIESWYLRLALYGKVKFHYRDTMTQTNKDCSFTFFLQTVTGEQELIRTMGAWSPEKTAYNAVTFSREFYGHTGKKEREEFTMKIEYRPELEKILKNY